MKPENTKQGITFFPIPEVNDPEIAFGLDASSYFDRYNLPEVPQKYESLANSLFFSGGELPAFKKHVDREKAIRWIKAALGSWAPAHESKSSTVGYALWCWSEGDKS